MTLDPLLLEILVDPEDKEPLWYFADEDALYNPRLRRRYAVRDGIPVLLISEAEDVSDDEHEQLVARSSSARRTGTPTEGGERAPSGM